MPSMMLSRRAKIALSVVGALIVLLVVLVKLAGTYVNYLWFGEVGQRGVFSTVLWTKLVLFLIFGTLMALIIGGNLVVAYVIKPPFRPMSPEQQNLQNYVLMVEPRRKLILAGVMVIAFLAAGASAQGDWSSWQLWLNGQSFGVQDPQFGLDVGFFAWDYPVYRLLLSFGFTAVIFSIILVIGIHYLSGAIRLQTAGPKITISARRQLTILVFVFMLLKAAAEYIVEPGWKRGHLALEPGAPTSTLGAIHFAALPFGWSVPEHFHRWRAAALVVHRYLNFKGGQYKNPIATIDGWDMAPERCDGDVWNVLDGAAGGLQRCRRGAALEDSIGYSECWAAVDVRGRALCQPHWREQSTKWFTQAGLRGQLQATG